MALSIWKPLLIDRIHLTMRIKEDEVYKFAWGQIWEILALHKSILPEGRIGKKKQQYSVRIDYFPDKKRKIAEIEIGQAYKYRYIKLVLYPSKFSGNEFCYFKEHFNGFFPTFCYENLFSQAHVSSIEFACDSLSHPANSLIPFRKKVSHSSVFDDHGTKGTKYLGSVKSNKRFRIYDKAKQLAETNQVAPHKLHTRIECALRKTKLSIPEILTKLENPFTGLEIAHAPTARTISKDLEWTDFLDTCESDGSARALASLSKNKRKIFMSRLLGARVAWWKPDSRWTGLEYALEKISP